MQIYKRGASQGSILRSLLILIYFNDFNRVSDIVDPVMFGGNTNLFFSPKETKTLFHTLNT